MCEPTSCGTLVYIHNNKNVSFTSDIFHHYIKACKNRRCDFAKFHFFYLSSQEMHRNFLTLSMHITEGKKKRVARGTEGKHQSGRASSPWWPYPRGVQSSSRSAVSATWRHRLRPHATISAKIVPPNLGAKSASPSERVAVQALPLVESNREE